jgi:hypothetical protein
MVIARPHPSRLLKECIAPFTQSRFSGHRSQHRRKYITRLIAGNTLALPGFFIILNFKKSMISISYEVRFVKKVFFKQTTYKILNDRLRS